MHIQINRDDLKNGNFKNMRYHNIDDDVNIKPILSMLYDVYKNEFIN